MTSSVLCKVMNARVPGMRSAASLVLTRLAFCAAPNGTGAAAFIDSLAEGVKVSRRTVHAALGWLVKANLIKCTKKSKGRGSPNVWALNLPLLEHYAYKPKAKVLEEPPEFGPIAHQSSAEPVEKGCQACTNSEEKRVHHLHERVQNLHERVQLVHPILLDPVLTLDAREKNSATGAACVQPDGRTPRKPDQELQIEKLSSKVEAGQAAGKHRFDAWASLLVAIVRRREAEALRFWLGLPARLTTKLPGRSPFAVTKSHRRQRLRALVPMLDELGWQLVVRGSG